MRKYKATSAALNALYLQDVIEPVRKVVATSDNPTICFENAETLAKEGNHVGAFRWHRLGNIWREFETERRLRSR